MGFHMIGTGCQECVDGACTMNCSSATTATGSEWIAASIWAGVFPDKATAEQVLAWRAAKPRPLPDPVEAAAGEDAVERIAAKMAASDGLNWEEHCGYEDDLDGCESSTCVAAHYDDHDPEVARSNYRKWAKVALDEARAALANAPAKAGCPFCTHQSKWTGDPADVFCEHHLRLCRSTGAA